MKEFQYDIAFSFLAQDEELAFKLFNLLKNQVNCFIYSEEQKKLAGRNGEDFFNKIFGKSSRIIAILYRDGWGHSPWTRIEETAIRNRAYDEGYDFVTLVKVGEEITPPKWLPKNRIWVGIERWGLEGAAASLESRIQEADGVIKRATAEEKARTVQDKFKFQKWRKEFLVTPEALQQADEEVLSLFDLMRDFQEKISDPANGFVFNNSSDRGHLYELDFQKRIGIVFRWIHVNNKASDSRLEIAIYKVADFWEPGLKNSKRSAKYSCEVNESKEIGWVKIGDDSSFKPTSRLADEWATNFTEEFDDVINT